MPWFMFKCGNVLLLLASGKCAYVSCKISDWNPWKGELPKDGCAQQIRTKDVTTTQHEKIQAENCQGLQTTCPEVPPETRTWCKDLNLLLIWRLSGLRGSSKSNSRRCLGVISYQVKRYLLIKEEMTRRRNEETTQVTRARIVNLIQY